MLPLVKKVKEMWFSVLFLTGSFGSCSKPPLMADCWLQMSQNCLYCTSYMSSSYYLNCKSPKTPEPFWNLMDYPLKGLGLLCSGPATVILKIFAPFHHFANTSWWFSTWTELASFLLDVWPACTLCWGWNACRAAVCSKAIQQRIGNQPRLKVLRCPSFWEGFGSPHWAQRHHNQCPIAPIFDQLWRTCNCTCTF